MQYLTGTIFKTLNNNSTLRKEYKTLYNAVNSCDISCIILDNNIYYIETIKPYTTAKMDVARKQLDKYMRKYYNATYLYNAVKLAKSNRCF